MKIRNAKRWVRLRPLSAYAIGALAAVVAFLLRYAMHSFLGPFLPFQVFGLTAILVEFFCGPGPAMLPVLTGLVLSPYFFVPPFGRFSSVEFSDLVYITNYLFVSMFSIAIVERLRRAEYARTLLLRVSNSRYRMLLHRDNARIHANRVVTKLSREFADVLGSLERIWLVRLPSGVDVPGLRMFVDTGIDAQAIVAGHGLTSVHAEDRAKLEQALGEAAAGGLPIRHLRLRVADGFDAHREAEFALRRLASRDGVYLVLTET